MSKVISDEELEGEIEVELYDHLIKAIKHQNFLNEQLLKARVDDNKIINILKQNQRNWNYLTKELRKLIEEHDSLYSYVTSNLSKRINERFDKKKEDTYTISVSNV